MYLHQRLGEVKRDSCPQECTETAPFLQITHKAIIAPRRHPRRHCRHSACPPLLTKRKRLRQRKSGDRVSACKHDATTAARGAAAAKMAGIRRLGFQVLGVDAHIFRGQCRHRPVNGAQASREPRACQLAVRRHAAGRRLPPRRIAARRVSR